MFCASDVWLKCSEMTMKLLPTYAVVGLFVRYIIQPFFLQLTFTFSHSPAQGELATLVVTVSRGACISLTAVWRTGLEAGVF